MRHLGSLGDPRGLVLREIAYLGARTEIGTWPQPGEGSDLRLRPDMRVDEMAEAMDGRAVLDDDAGTDDDVRLDEHVLADPGVVAEEYGFGRHERRAFRHHLVAQA